MPSCTHFLFACGRSVRKALFRKLGKNNPLLLATLIVFSDGPRAPRLPSCWNPVPLTSSSLPFSILFPILFHTSVSFFFKIPFVCLFVYMSRGQRTAGQSPFSPSIMWLLMTELRFSGTNRQQMWTKCWGIFFFRIFISLGITGYNWLDRSTHNNNE